MQNCWDYHGCGREAGGAKVKELGVCPASVNKKLDGFNRGTCGGRSCFVVEGTLCGSQKQGDVDDKRDNCLKCEFYKQVKREEGASFYSSARIIPRLRPAYLGWKLETGIALSAISAMVLTDYLWLNLVLG